MSGRKYTRVSPPTYGEMERTARDYASDYARRVEKRAERMAENVRRETERRDRELQQSINKVEQRGESMFRDFQNRLNAVRNETQKDLAAAEQRLQQAMHEQGRALQNQISQLQSRNQKEDEVAGSLLSAAEQETALIRSVYLHEFFAPRELEIIEQRLDQARENLRAGLSALAPAQESLLQAQQLHLRLESKQNVWESKRAQALARVEGALETLQEADTFNVSQVPDLEAQKTDYWADGAWSALREDLQARKTRLEDTQHPAGVEEIDQYAEEAENAGPQIAEIVTLAQQNLIASIHRADMQMAFYEQLKNSGYEIVDNAWLGEDERRSNHLIMQGANGDRIAIVVRPAEVGDGNMTNEVEVDFEDVAPSKILRSERLTRLQQTLGEIYGGAAGQFEPMPGADWEKNAPAHCFDLEAVRRGEEGHGEAQRRRVDG